ncbi:MAG: molybdopterin molybdenumtransferase MoeA [Deltaproteobacteria bacterium]|nr:MAG: molybdopterin molybdenumtransferase MoeA [Deltaproteobacteria bacterium]
MLSIEQAQAHILSDVPRTGAEQVPLASAYGRVLAETIRSPRHVPPWDNSAMDGYAVRAADIPSDGSDVRLELLEIVGAGRMPEHVVRSGTASAVMTGAPIPEGADAIVMVEHSDGAREGHVTLRGPVREGQHIRRAGEDIAEGSVVLGPGARLTPGRVGLVASLGVPSLLVSRRPVVAILSTGDEVVPPGRPLKPGQIYSSNNATLAGLVHEAGGVPLDLGNAVDDLDALRTRLGYAVHEGHLVVTTGGVSVGTYDLVKQVFEELAGDSLDFWKVRMKPGKPLAFGRVARGGRTIPLFGLPGNPVSCMVNFLQFVRPWIRTSMGDPRPFLPVIDAVAGEDIPEKPGRAKLLRVVLDSADGQVVARLTGTQSSGALSSMAAAQGLLLLAPEAGGVKAGEAVRVQVVDAQFLAGDTPSYGW